jgi:hypothetical protein
VASGDATFFEGVAQLACCANPDYATTFGPDINEALQLFAESRPQDAVVEALTLSMGWCMPPTAPISSNAWSWLKSETAQLGVRRVTMPLLHAAERDVALVFCANMMEPLLRTTDEAYLTVDPGMCTTSTDAILQCQRKSACFSVLGALFNTLKEDDIRTGVIEKQFVTIKKLGEDGTNMFYKAMCKKDNPASLVGTLKLARTWDCCTAPDCRLREARRELACSAFNALGGMHICAQPPEKLANIINKFLLKLDAYPALVDTKTALHTLFKFPRTGNEQVKRRHGVQFYVFEMDYMDLDLRRALKPAAPETPKPTAAEHVIAVHKELFHRTTRALSGHESFPAFVHAIDAILAIDDDSEMPAWIRY